jgi:hypothetical protein
LPPVSPAGLTATGDAQRRHRLRRDFGEQLAGEDLVPLDLRAGSGRADGESALRLQRVDDAGCERLVGADHRDVDLTLARVGGDSDRVADVADPVPAARALGVKQDRRVRVADEGVQLGVLGHAHRQRALPSSMANHERPHGVQSRAELAG